MEDITNFDPSEIAELKSQIENFKKEKERVRSIVGQIGGMPTSTSRIYNVVFIVLVIGCLIASLLSEGTFRLAVVEIAVALLSLKIIYLMHNQSRVNHFQLWILTSLEWRLNEIVDQMDKITPGQGEEFPDQEMETKPDGQPATQVS